MELAYVLDNFHHHLSGTITLGANHLFVCVAVDLDLSSVEYLVCDIRNWSRICFAQEGHATPYDLNESSEIVFSK